MALLLHISIALASVAYSTYLFAAPSPLRFRVSYGLVASTIASGTYLTLANPSHMVQACVSGLLYTSVVLTAIIMARHKLAKQDKYL